MVRLRSWVDLILSKNAVSFALLANFAADAAPATLSSGSWATAVSCLTFAPTFLIYLLAAFWAFESSAVFFYSL
jgi:hypothetical protein